MDAQVSGATKQNGEMKEHNMHGKKLIR